jgi:hypothetical protein
MLPRRRCPFAAARADYEQPDLAAEWGNSIPEQGSRVLIVDSVLPDGGMFVCFASCGLGKITQWIYLH